MFNMVARWLFLEFATACSSDTPAIQQVDFSRVVDGIYELILEFPILINIRDFSGLFQKIQE